jgi:hypothetical protein
MEAVRSFEMLTITCKTTQRHNREDHNVNSHAVKTSDLIHFRCFTMETDLLVVYIEMSKYPATSEHTLFRVKLFLGAGMAKCSPV